MRRILVPAFAIVIGLVAAGCGDGMARGVMITGQGKVGTNSDINQRNAAQDALAEAIGTDIGPDWKVAVAIAELPVWVEDMRGGQVESGDWRWEKISATVTLTAAAGVSLPPTKIAELEQGGRNYLKGKLRQRKDDQVAIMISVVNQPAAVATPAPQMVVMAPAAVPAAAPAAPAPRSYAIQPGDTLAEISTAFYGSPNHWRAILTANPGLDPAALTPGQAIVIPVLAAPALPAPAAPAPQPAPAH